VLRIYTVVTIGQYFMLSYFMFSSHLMLSDEVIFQVNMLQGCLLSIITFAAYVVAGFSWPC